MKAVILLMIVSVLLLFCGCQQTFYVCKDGKTVSDMKECEETIIITGPENTSQENKTAAAQKPGEPAEEKPITRFEGDYYAVNEEKTDRGITLKFLGYYYIKKGDDFGKITGIKYTIINNAPFDITPYFKLSMFNNIGDRDLRVAEINMEAIKLNSSKSMDGENAVALSFNKLNITKTLQLDIYDSPYKGTSLFIIETKADFSGKI